MFMKINTFTLDRFQKNFGQPVTGTQELLEGTTGLDAKLATCLMTLPISVDRNI